MTFSVQPAGAVVGYPLLQQPIITIVDAYENRVFNSSAVVTLQRYFTGSVLYTSTASQRVTTFTSIRFNELENDVYYFYASVSSLSPAVSEEFDVVSAFGSAVKILVHTNPSNGVSNVALNTQPVFKVCDSLNQVVNDFNGFIMLSVYSGPGKISGSASVFVINGYATFTDISLSLASSSYSLKASSEGLVPAFVTFAVNRKVSLIFINQPLSIDVDESFSVSVKVANIDGSLASSSSIKITLSLKSDSSALSGTISAYA